ncbi:MAG: superinfection immunity protein [Cytophagales bacterium]|nr:superinfection immunity protein [Cytophagales bacterium]
MKTCPFCQVQLNVKQKLSLFKIMGAVAVILIFVLGAMLYFLPTILGWNKRNVVAIFLLNLLLGWSLIGWIVALIWALAKDATTTVVVHNNSAPSIGMQLTDQLTKLDELRQRGVINEGEFEMQKKRLLSV